MGWLVEAPGRYLPTYYGGGVPIFQVSQKKRRPEVKAIKVGGVGINPTWKIVRETVLDG